MTRSIEAGAEPPREARPGSHPAKPSTDHPSAIALPIIGAGRARPAGLVLRRAALPHGATELFEILVADADGSTLLRFGPFDQEEVVASWRALSATSGLPLVIENAGGERQCPCPQLGRVQLGAIRIRRRNGLLSGRRPRFSARRKTGQLPLRPQVFREREMFGRGP